MAYFWVQVRAIESYLDLSVLYIWAISGTRGSSGFGSVSNEHIERSTWKCNAYMVIIIIILQNLFVNTFDMVRAGLHWSLRISKHIFPLLFMFGWNTFVLKATCIISFTILIMSKQIMHNNNNKKGGGDVP